MGNDKCYITVTSNTEDGKISVIAGDIKDDIIIKTVNADGDSSEICITKNQLNELVKLVNKHL